MYDVAIIGAGTGGLTAARLLARAGRRVALIERDRPGGDCLWSGCVPTKALIHAASVYHDARHGMRFGTNGDGVTLDFAAVRQHVALAQEQAGRADTPDVIRSWGVTLVIGDAQFRDRQTLKVAGQPIRARTFIIATGSSPATPPIPGISAFDFDTNVEALSWERLPASVAVLGGGPVGVEFAQAMARFGVDVTLVEREARLLGSEEPEASQLVADALRDDGVRVLTDASVDLVEPIAGGASLSVATTVGVEALSVERLLVAAGRKASADTLGLEAAGVRVSARGVEVDACLRTSQPHIFAVGDVNGGPRFTHVAEDQARTVSGTITRGRGLFARPARWNGRVVPRVTFSSPEVASVGLTEREARHGHRGVRTWTVPLERVDRAVTMGATRGFVKLVTARGWPNRIPGLASRIGDEIVGACIVGPNAGELLMPIAVAMRARLPTGVVAWNMQAYPTLSLAVRQAVGMRFDPGD